MSKFIIAFAAAVVLGVVTFTGSLGAMPVAHINFITFSGPVALPGVSLPAGTYVFESPMVDVGDARVVRVSSRDGRLTYATLMTLPVVRASRDAAAARIVFGEAPRTSPAPIRIWYPAGAIVGHQFIYSPAR